MNISLRDYFAAHAMQGLIAQSCGTAIGSDVMHGAKYAYAMADAMMTARNNDDGWIEWNGGERPVQGDTFVEVKCRDDATDRDKASAYYWHHNGDYCDIVAYRVIEK